MHTLIFVLLVFICTASCNFKNNERNNRITITLKYKDSLELGKVSCILPSDFDTIYNWYNSSDCTCCGSINYRSHSKQYDIVKESGFLFDDRIDSGFYFTIGHYTKILCDTQGPPEWDKDIKTESEILKQNIEYFIKDLSKRKLGVIPDVLVDTGRVINSHTYNILYYNELLGQNPFNILSASTSHNNKTIGFSIQSNVHPTDSFYEIAMTILKSIQIQ